MQRPTRVYIVETRMQTGESKEATESSAFNAKTAETAMTTFSFFLPTVHAHTSH
jgi:hypothetical protein